MKDLPQFPDIPTMEITTLAAGDHKDWLRGSAQQWNRHTQRAAKILQVFRRPTADRSEILSPESGPRKIELPKRVIKKAKSQDLSVSNLWNLPNS